jgi:hypothetical protein
MSETTETTETPAAEGEEQVVAEETQAEEPSAELTPAEAAVEEQVAEEAAVPTAVVDAESEAPAAEEVAEAVIPLPSRVARIYVCERGHRTTTLWSTPTTCQARPVRSAPVCGRPLYHITELPEQVQKALNPLKASKKASKK